MTSRRMRRLEPRLRRCGWRAKRRTRPASSAWTPCARWDGVVAGITTPDRSGRQGRRALPVRARGRRRRRCGGGASGALGGGEGGRR
eukprot:2358331-Pleurochrysis_carterae.AAC.1